MKIGAKDLKQKFNIRILLLIAFIGIITILAWQSDDSYHGYVMAKHLVEGNGFVYNIGQRSSATTGPLFTLLIALAYFITREMFFTSIAVCVIFSTLAYYLVTFKLCKSDEQVILSFFALIGSASFVSYTTSGLENSLLFFLVVWFITEYYEHETFTAINMLKLALIFAFLAMARMDAVLMLIPAIVYIYLMKRKNVSFIGACGLTVIGLMPFILWELFSVFYFGFFVPNTAYVKLGTDISLIEYIKKGIYYVYYTALNDLMVLIIPATCVIICILTKKVKNIYLALGMLLYGVYILYIGGDFMMGRHFTVLHIMGIAIIIHIINDEASDKKAFAIQIKNSLKLITGIAVVFAMTFAPTIGASYLVNGANAPGGALSDERAYYSPTTGLYANVRSLIKDGRMCIEDTWNNQSTDEIRENGWKGNITENAPGILVYYNSDLYLNDTYCLGDPFLSKLPAIYQETWRVGHMRRAVPEGYCETAMYGRNEIANEDLAKYYDIICEMTMGPLFDKHRIETVINWNLGKYDYLLEDYISKL